MNNHKPTISIPKGIVLLLFTSSSILICIKNISYSYKPHCDPLELSIIVSFVMSSFLLQTLHKFKLMPLKKFHVCVLESFEYLFIFLGITVITIRKFFPGRFYLIDGIVWAMLIISIIGILVVYKALLDVIKFWYFTERDS